MIFIAGLFFGPYGALGAVVANIICDLVRGYYVPAVILSAIVNFILSYLAYKLWYSRDFKLLPVTKPRLINLSNLIYLILMAFVCSVFYALFILNMVEIFYPNVVDFHFLALRYFVNFVNFSLLFSMILMIISRYNDFSYTPKTVDKQDTKLYSMLFVIISVITLIFIILNHILGMNMALSSRNNWIANITMCL